MHSTKKSALRTFYYSCFKVVQWNCRKFCAKFSYLLKNKFEYAPSSDDSGKICEDYFTQAITDALKEIEKKDNFAGYTLVTGILAFFILTFLTLP